MQKGLTAIQSLQRKWTLRLLLVQFIWIVSATMILSVATLLLFDTGILIIPVLLIATSAIFFGWNYKKITEKDVVIFLNRQYPQLEESSGLLLRPADTLNPLELLQRQKIEMAISADAAQPPVLTKKIKRGIWVLAGTVIISICLYYLSPLTHVTQAGNTGSDLHKKPETKLPGIEKVSILVTPPAYTGRKQRRQNRFNISIEEGGKLGWQIETATPVKQLQLVFNDRSLISLTPDAARMKWTAQKQVNAPGFYQVKMDGTLSELYQLDLIRDASPVIVVQSPKPNTLIEPWMQPRTQLQVSISDDYGVSNAYISATMASGNGEAVRFKQQQIGFANFSAGASRYQLQKLLDLKALGLNKGDELYFYISATDFHNQEKRSDIYIIRIEDTAQLMSIEGLANGIDIKPEFFRSQRQIIIETEQLLREKDTVSAEDFTKRSNNLGIDQKLLRLRYSKFLGEETDAEIGGEHEGEEHESGDFGNAQQMLDEVTHKHDNAEDATFFDAATKKQLQATLAEMWKSELQLRVMKPRDALPFQYAALRLLKELQQQSRVYVAKTGIKTTPLKPEKRLTGELDKIREFSQQQNFQPDAGGSLLLRKSMGILEQLRNKEPLTPASRSLLEQAGVQLSQRAAAEPSLYLTALQAYRRILENQTRATDIPILAKALQKMISSSKGMPFQHSSVTDMNLSQRYFQHLNGAND